MNKNKIITIKIIIIIVLILFPNTVFAHPGRTDSSGCHTCRTNCSKYGLYTGQYHCHNGGSTNNNNYSSNTPITPKPVPKSSDNTLNSINIDGENINITNEITYITSKENVTINVTTNDSKAKYEIKNNSSLIIGKNNISIEVTAENGAIKIYNIVIIRKNNDATLESITIDGETFKVTDTIEYSTRKSQINIKVKPNDINATYKIKNNESLTIGNNNIIIEVTAEDGTNKIYNINVDRKRILSSNTEVDIFINEEKIVFENNKATINVPSSTKTITINHILKDKNATVKIDKLKEIKTGNNLLNVLVTAEDNTKQKYQINIYKYSKIEDTVYSIIAFGIIGGIGYSIYFILKKLSKKITKK